MLAFVAAVPAAARAFPAGAVAGVELSQGAAGETTRGALLAGTARLAGVQATLAGLRYDDNVIGTGSGVTAGLGLPLQPMLSLQLQGSRYLGDGSYRGWRTKLGPELDLPGGASALLAWSHQEDNLGTRLDAAVLESSVPLVAGVAARANGTFGRLPDQRTSAAGSAGLSWTGLPHLQLIGELGMALNGASPFGSTSPHPLLGMVGLGRNASTPPPGDVVSRTYLLGVRVTLP